MAGETTCDAVVEGPAGVVHSLRDGEECPRVCRQVDASICSQLNSPLSGLGLYIGPFRPK